MKKPQKQLKGQLSIWDSPFKEILEGYTPPITKQEVTKCKTYNLE